MGIFLLGPTVSYALLESASRRVSALTLLFRPSSTPVGYPSASWQATDSATRFTTASSPSWSASTA